MAKTIGQLTSATTIANGDLFVIEQSSQTFKIAASVVRGGLVDADVDAAAAIVYSKLDLDDSIVTGDLTDDAVTTAKIDDDAVTTAKILDANVTTGKVADAAITPAKLSQPFTMATAQASTSGTSIDFTGIPSWAKRITVMFSEISTNGSSFPIVQIGDSGGIEATGYTGATGYSGVGSGANSYSTGFFLNIGVAASTLTSGVASLLNISGNQWVFGLSAGYVGSAYSLSGGGNKTLSATLDRVRITTVNGTDTFDAGSINISYEG
jgi:hypothetical protein